MRKIYFYGFWAENVCGFLGGSRLTFKPRFILKCRVPLKTKTLYLKTRTKYTLICKEYFKTKIFARSKFVCRPHGLKPLYCAATANSGGGLVRERARGNFLAHSISARCACVQRCANDTFAGYVNSLTGPIIKLDGFT